MTPFFRGFRQASGGSCRWVLYCRSPDPPMTGRQWCPKVGPGSRKKIEVAPYKWAKINGFAWGSPTPRTLIFSLISTYQNGTFNTNCFERLLETHRAKLWKFWFTALIFTARWGPASYESNTNKNPLFSWPLKTGRYVTGEYFTSISLFLVVFLLAPTAPKWWFWAHDLSKLC